jgi:potassium-transporting ATPase ATP-binding subunit
MRKTQTLFDAALLKAAAWDALRRLSPRHQVKNPVMFVVWLGGLLTAGLFVQAQVGQGEVPGVEKPAFILAVSLWLWFTVLFANLAEAVAEGRGKAQAAALKGMRRAVLAKKLTQPRHDAPTHVVNSAELRKGDLVLVTAGEIIPGDGEVV